MLNLIQLSIFRGIVSVNVETCIKFPQTFLLEAYLSAISYFFRMRIRRIIELLGLFFAGQIFENSLLFDFGLIIGYRERF